MFREDNFLRYFVLNHDIVSMFLVNGRPEDFQTQLYSFILRDQRSLFTKRELSQRIEGEDKEEVKLLY